MDWLFQLGAPVVLMLALNVIGLAIKRSPVPDYVIVWALPILGGIAYPFVAESSKVTAQHSTGLNVLYGIVIGGGAVWGNQLIKQTVAAWASRQQNPPNSPPPLAKP